MKRNCTENDALSFFLLAPTKKNMQGSERTQKFSQLIKVFTTNCANTHERKAH